MPRHLPPLNAVKAFEATARQGSVSQAAKELHVTQGAVSKQIKLLEAYLNVSLFTRHPGGIRLTAAGRQYLTAIGESLDVLAFASAQVQRQPAQAPQVVLDVSPSLAALWLIPQLPQLQRQHPQINLSMRTGDGPVNFAQSRSDCAIRCLPTHPSPANSVKLCDERLILLATPAIAARITRFDAVATGPRIQHSTRPDMWQCVPGVDAPHSGGDSAFEHFFMSLEAAKAGLGLALVPDFLAATAVAQQQVVPVLNFCHSSDFAYYVLTPGYKAQLHPVQAVCRWLLSLFPTPP